MENRKKNRTLEMEMGIDIEIVLLLAILKLDYEFLIINRRYIQRQNDT